MYDERGRDVVAYRATHVVEAHVPVDRAGAMIDMVVPAGAARIDGVTFTLSQETRRDLWSAALETAVENARADLELLGVRTASTADVSYGFADGGDERTADLTVIDPGPVTVTAEVSETFEAR